MKYKWFTRLSVAVGLAAIVYSSVVQADVYNNYASGAPLLGTDIFLISKNGAGTRKVTPSDINTYVIANTPAYTGDVTKSAGGTVLTISTGAVTNAKIANGTIDLTTKVTNALPSANGGAGTINGIMKANGAGVTSVSVAGTDYVAPGTATTFTRQQVFGTATLTDASSIAWNLATSQTAKVTLTGDHTLANPTNMVDGGHYTLRVIQDGTGGRLFSFDTAYKFQGGVAPNNTTDASAVDLLSCESDGSAMYCVMTNDLR